ncbi:MAG TPA: amino acid racemase [archaeon]|nr:amino acid racemase [archaeon]
MSKFQLAKGMRRIGILGGMGPESTALFYQKIIEQCQKLYGAKYDQDYPKIFIYSLPLPDPVRGIRDGTLRVLTNGLKKLESFGADFIAIPCNTINCFLPEMRKCIQIPIVGIIEETIGKIESERYKKVGLLATIPTIENNLYKSDKIKIITPLKRDQKTVNKVICNILAGKKLDEDKKLVGRIIRNLLDRGAEAIVLGCTDLPLLIKQEDYDVKIFDTVEILAESTVRYATGIVNKEVF